MQTIGVFLEAIGHLLPSDVDYSTEGLDFDGHSAPPAISLYPSSETFAAPVQPNRLPRKDEGRAIMTRKVTVIANLWGSTIEATEELLRRLVVACREIATGPYFSVGSAQWLGSRGLVKEGHVLSLTITVDLALQADAPRTVHPNSMTTAREYVDAPPKE